MRKSLPVVLALFFSVLILPITGIPGSVKAFTWYQQQAVYAGELQTYLENQMKTYKIPGMSVAIVRNGEVEYLDGLGIANPDGSAVTPETPFLLASVSKSMTALAVMQLIEAGKINLEDPVEKFLPWFGVSGEDGSKITVAQLLYQTSGFSNIDGVQANLKPDTPDALETGVRELAAGNLEFDPGDGWEYSNLNYAVLGLLIQQVSGQRYEEYIQDHIFTPLEMDHSYTSMSAARAGGAASGYYPFFGIPVVYDKSMAYSRATLPAGGLWSSASDMSRYLIAYLNGGRYDETTLLSAASIDTLHQPGYMFNNEQGYAMGWTVNYGFMTPELLEPLDTELKDYGKLTVLFHEGDWTNYKSMAFLIPEIDYGVILLMNTNDPTITSGFRFFAWDVTLIATGGEPQYFPPAEDFIVRSSRWIFGALSLLLAAGLLRSFRTLKKIQQGRSGSNASTRTVLFQAAIPILIVVALNGYIFLKLLPENGANLRTLFGFAPDLGILVLLILLLSIVWSIISIARFGSIWKHSRKVILAKEAGAG